MGEDIIGTITHVPVASTGVMFHELEDQVRSIRIKGRPFDARWTFSNLLVEKDGVGFGFMERRQSRKHLEYKDAESVPVYGFVVSRIGNDLWLIVRRISNTTGKVQGENIYLWRKVVRRTAQCPRHVLAVLSKTEIGDFYVPVIIEEDVLWFEITVNDVEIMKVVEGQGNFRYIEFCYWVGKAL